MDLHALQEVLKSLRSSIETEYHQVIAVHIDKYEIIVEGWDFIKRLEN